MAAMLRKVATFIGGVANRLQGPMGDGDVDQDGQILHIKQTWNKDIGSIVWRDREPKFSTVLAHVQERRHMDDAEKVRHAMHLLEQWPRLAYLVFKWQHEEAMRLRKRQQERESYERRVRARREADDAAVMLPIQNINDDDDAKDDDAASSID